MGRLCWQEVTSYGGRALVETTMGRYKALIGDRLRACSEPVGRTPSALRVPPTGSVGTGAFSSCSAAVQQRRDMRRIGVGLEPHGLTLWPQPGRYSIGHAGKGR